MDSKVDELSVVERRTDAKEHEVSVLLEDRKEDELSVVERRTDTKEHEVSVLLGDRKEDEPSVLKGDTKEHGLGFSKGDTKKDELSKKMDTKEDAEAHEDRPASPYEVLQHLSEEAVRVAGEALQTVYFSSPSPQQAKAGHRRSQSEIGTLGHRRANSFQKLKTQVQRAWRWGSHLREEGCQLDFNPEVLANQKRLWYQLHSKTTDHTKYKEPTSLFEHFIIVGIHPDANLEAVEEAFANRKKWEMEMDNSEMTDFKTLQHRRPSNPILEPQILFKYPPGTRLAMRPKDLAAFCFPGGVKARLLERTPSLSDLNELVYGQEHLGKDDSSFIFSVKAADDATLYGVCLHVSEIVQRPPGILSASSPLPHLSGACSRFLVSAPRCYCVLTRVPFFELHFEMLNSIIAQERLNRITHFVMELSVTTSCGLPSLSKLHDQMNDNSDSPDDEVPSSSRRTPEPRSPESVTASESSDVGHIREIDRDGRKSSQYYDDNTSEASENRSDALDRICGSYESCQASPEIGTFFCSRSRMLEHLGSSESSFSPARSMASEDEDDELFPNNDKDFGDDFIMEWAKENKNGLLQIVCGYHAVPLPQRGSEVVFHPLEHLQPIEYKRLPVSAFGFSEEYLDSCVASEKVNAKLAAAEEAHALSIWTAATVCRVLSLESILAILTGVLLEKQVVVVCPNLGVLSATVLSLVPMIRPFQWQSLLLPVLPGRMLDFLDAPVPFIVGIQSKPADLKIKTSNLIQVNVFKDQVKTCHLPSLPRRRELIAQLRPLHARLSYESSIAKRHPVYRCNEIQAETAMRFLTAMRDYLESLCSDLRSYTITSVQSNNDRVSLLLKDSFIESFPSKDQPFIKLFVDTQLFSVLSDSRLSSLENGQL